MSTTSVHPLRRRGTTRQIVASAARIDWSQVEFLSALRCTAGVAIPLVGGIAFDRPTVGVFGAVGALSVGFGAFQGAYRSRAAVMLLAAIGMACSILAGTLAGGSLAAATIVAGLWGFGSGLLVSLGPAASFVGLQSAVGALLAAGFPVDAMGILARSGLVLAGGLLQILLVVLVWPLRRFPAERATVATAYRSLADYADTLSRRWAMPPEPHTWSRLESPGKDPQPFARVGELGVFQALLDQGERIRTALASLATVHGRLTESGDAAGAGDVAGLAQEVSRVLAEVAAAVQDGRAARAGSAQWRSVERAGAAAASRGAPADALLGQLRAAWRMTSVPTTRGGDEASDARVRSERRLWSLRDAFNTLTANLTLRSTACRHALRLGVTLAVATGLYRAASLERGYWLSLTVLLVLKPEFQETFSRGVARVGGTLLGAAFATLITILLAPGPLALAVLVLLFVWLGYALFRASYAVFTVCITGYVVFLVSLAGVPELTAVTERSVDTILGGALALLVYALWPTWESSRVRDLLAALLEAQARYAEALLAAYAETGPPDLTALERVRAPARLARSNAEASVERMLGEPIARHHVDPHLAAGVLAAVRRFALAALALHADLDAGRFEPAPAVGPFAAQVRQASLALADAVRSGRAPAAWPPLRATQLALGTLAGARLTRETDVFVDSLDTMRDLVVRDAERAGQRPSVA
jgi:uncharacterized membrane protein YccC